jgi:hypothetical protein
MLILFLSFGAFIQIRFFLPFLLRPPRERECDARIHNPNTLKKKQSPISISIITMHNGLLQLSSLNTHEDALPPAKICSGGILLFPSLYSEQGKCVMITWFPFKTEYEVGKILTLNLKQ